MNVRMLLWILGSQILCASITTQGIEEEDDTLDNVCHIQVSCGRCIAVNPACAWCMLPDYEMMGHKRCDNVETLEANGCPSEYIVNPSNHQAFIKNVLPHDSSREGDAVQLSPQEVAITLRPHVAHSLEVTFRQAKDYPVDLYYIMDLSNTMLKSKKQVANLGNELAIQMRNITANFRLGFGSYIDKNISPYISVVPEKLDNPCRTTVCVPTYAFKNHLPLTSDVGLFTKAVRESRISGNLDTPEGTLDAMMQAVVCKDGIGWRDVSRKILLVSTDNSYHYAGDGKLAGIVRPNDGFCHLSENNEYNMSLYQDYPSVSHLAHRVEEENINVIFGIIDRLKALSTYRALTSLIRGSVVVKLEEDSSNIVDVIKENYERISSKVELRHEAPDDVSISYSSSCLGDKVEEVSFCDRLKVGDSVTFTLTLNVTSCPADGEDNDRLVTIYPAGLSDRLLLRLTVQCSCPCERPDFDPVGHVTAPEPYSDWCGNVGTYQCGSCVCESGFYGEMCQCSKADEERCKRTPTSEICEGRGFCDCGACVCDKLSATDRDKHYTGEYCECDDYSCDSYAGKLCGGPERGQCVCGRCMCREGFTGSSCNCRLTTDTCVGTNQLLCSGHGQCVCGQCHCDANYQGRTCDICPSCPGQCEANKACVQCVAFGTGQYSESECKANCTHVNIVTEISRDDSTDGLVCKFRDEDKCDFYFTYSSSTRQVFVQRTKECPQPVNKIGIILGVVGAIIAIGMIVLIIWKIIITIYDRKEYEKFVRERDAAKWKVEGNPIYKPSTSTFRNPTFAKVK